MYSCPGRSGHPAFGPLAPQLFHSEKLGWLDVAVVAYLDAMQPQQPVPRRPHAAKAQQRDRRRARRPLPVAEARPVAVDQDLF